MLYSFTTKDPVVIIWSGTCVTNLGWFGQFHTKSSVWLHGQLLLLISLVRSLPATLYTFYTILNMLSEWFKPTRSGSIVLSGHGKWLCSDIPRQLGSRTSVAGLWSGAGLARNMDIFSNPTKVHGRVLWANPITISHFLYESHWYWDVGRPEWVSGTIPTTAPCSPSRWQSCPCVGYRSICPLLWQRDVKLQT